MNGQILNGDKTEPRGIVSHGAYFLRLFLFSIVYYSRDYISELLIIEKGVVAMRDIISYIIISSSQRIIFNDQYIKLLGMLLFSVIGSVSAALFYIGLTILR